MYRLFAGRVSFGSFYIVWSALLLICGYFIDRKQLGVATLANVFLTGMAFGLMPGIGTLIAAFFMGPLIEWFSVHLARPLLKGKT